jgi:hypothetical protein
MIGYLLEQELASELPGAPIATLLTQVVVDPAAAAFRRPTKPIGPLYDQAAARQLAASRGWLMERDGPGYRRMVASPQPLQILELETIRLLVNAGVVVVCAGGAGIPITVDEAGGIPGRRGDYRQGLVCRPARHPARSRPVVAAHRYRRSMDRLGNAPSQTVGRRPPRCPAGTPSLRRQHGAQSRGRLSLRLGHRPACRHRISRRWCRRPGRRRRHICHHHHDRLALAGGVRLTQLGGDQATLATRSCRLGKQRGRRTTR